MLVKKLNNDPMKYSIIIAIIFFLFLTNCNHTIKTFLKTGNKSEMFEKQTDYRIISDYYRVNNYKPFESISDSNIYCTENDSLVNFEIDIPNKDKLNFKILKSSVYGNGNYPFIYVNDKLASTESSIIYYSLTNDSIKYDLGFQNFSHHKSRLKYQEFDGMEYLLYSVGYKGAVGSFALNSVWFLLSINTENDFVLIIEDFSGLLREKSFGDFNNDGQLDFLMYNNCTIDANSEKRIYIYDMYSNNINNSNIIISDSLFSFKCDRYGDYFDIIK